MKVLVDRIHRKIDQVAGLCRRLAISVRMKHNTPPRKESERMPPLQVLQVDVAGNPSQRLSGSADRQWAGEESSAGMEVPAHFLARGVIHELLNSISIISSRFQFMEDEIPFDQVGEDLKICREQLKRITTILQEIQHASRYSKQSRKEDDGVGR